VKTLFSIISPVLPISVLISIFACMAAGSVGPCGPNGRYAIFYLIGYPIGFVGIIQSGYRAIANFDRAHRNKRADVDRKL
jgi:hypothetical protein